MYFQSKGLIPTPKYIDANGNMKDVPPPDPVFPADVVRAVVHKYELPAPQVWEMTIPDLFLMLRPPEDSNVSAEDKGGQLVNLILLEERMNLLAKLSVWERIELEQWKSELM